MSLLRLTRPCAATGRASRRPSTSLFGQVWGSTRGSKSELVHSTHSPVSNSTRLESCSTSWKVLVPGDPRRRESPHLRLRPFQPVTACRGHGDGGVPMPPTRSGPIAGSPTSTHASQTGACNTTPPEHTSRTRLCTTKPADRAMRPGNCLPPIPFSATGFTRGHIALADCVTAPAVCVTQFAGGIIPLAGCVMQFVGGIIPLSNCVTPPAGFVMPPADCVMQPVGFV
jgi:hypothetical protein